MFYDEKGLAPPEVSDAELEDFHVSERFWSSESTICYHRAKKAALSNPEVQATDEETAKSPFALPDELVTKVLGYLPLRDRFRLETVCKQWQRCMYHEVEDLYLDFRRNAPQKYTLRINNMGEITSSFTKELPAALHKLRNSKVGLLTCDIQDKITDRELFVLLAGIASQATKVAVAYGINFSPINFITFCDIIGPHVTTILLCLHQWQELPEDIQAFADSFARMKQLKELGSNWLDFIFTCMNSLPTNSLPYFQEIDIGFSGECDWKLWEHFKSLYGAQLKIIRFRTGHWLDDEDKVLLPWKDMASFENLEHLDFKFRLNDCTLTALAEDLEATSRSCPLLASLRLVQEDVLNQGFVVSLMEVQKLFVAIGKLKMLEKLDLELAFSFENLGDISLGDNLDLFALLENKTNITHLKADVRLFNISPPNKRFCPIIGSSLNSTMPSLRHLNISCMVSELVHFVGLERMQTINLYFHSEDAPEAIQNSLILILKSSPALRSIKVCHWFVKVSEALIRALMEVAELQMEKRIDFFAELQVLNELQKAWDARKHLAPRNLTIIFEDDIFSFQKSQLNLL